ncbi:HIPL1 protein-like [Oryza brachyantha]|uniref:HIPL1 protein-like n=1 Tax=Oryza brachyantha TaxID=4533 RepID=UPI001AD9B484|nr:HIPL1 protein-like [Oryza brachyantha]
MKAPPVVLDVAGLRFCANRGVGDLSCCDAAADAALESRFEAMGINRTGGGRCAGLIKFIICEVAIFLFIFTSVTVSSGALVSQRESELFNTGSATKAIPLLCSSSHSEDPSHSEEKYCEKVWKHCKSTAISNSPFQPSAKEYAGFTRPSFMPTDFWSTENEFCAAFASTPNNQSSCFNGYGALSNTRKLSASPSGMCLEKISDGPYSSMVAHPDGSSKAFFSSQDGKIWLAAIPEQGKGDILQLDETDPFLDLMPEGYLGSEFRFVSTAFHPDFTNNGRFFVSYICDRTQSPSSASKCSCDCDLSKLGSVNCSYPCQYSLVVSEYSAKGPSSNSSESTYADPSEVRRIFSMGLPYASNQAANISELPSFELAELNESASKSLCGNYTIPVDNPSADDSGLRPEIWAFGLTNPGRCSFDSAKTYHLYCTDDAEGEYKVVDLISKGGNYKWSDVYKGHTGAPPPWAAQGTKPSDSIIFPVMSKPDLQ